jgi:predicted DNA-binding transcriptional regulator AlpA
LWQNNPAVRLISRGLLEFMTALDEQIAPAAHGSKLLTADELAARWQVPRSWVYAASRTGRIPTLRLGHYCRYRLEAIEEWEAAQQTDP